MHADQENSEKKNNHLNRVSNKLILNTIMHNSEDTIYFKDKDSKFIVNSEAHAKQVGETSVKKMIGKSDFDYFPEEFAKKAHLEEKEIMRTGKAKTNIVEKWVQDNNEVMWFSASKYPFYDETGEIIGTWGISKVITLLKNAEEQLENLNLKLHAANENLEKLSIHDSLSGLYNHRHFYDRVNIAFSKAERYKNQQLQSGFSIVLFDIDHFKAINDTYGHLIGDQVIKQVGDYVKENIRSIDSSYRYGGDEFVVMNSRLDRREAYSFAEKIRKSIQDMTITYDDINVQITISVGVVSSDEADSVNKLMELADQRMYQSKEAGRNCVT